MSTRQATDRVVKEAGEAGCSGHCFIAPASQSADMVSAGREAGRFRVSNIPSEPTQLHGGSSGCSIKFSDENFRGEK